MKRVTLVTGLVLEDARVNGINEIRLPHWAPPDRTARVHGADEIIMTGELPPPFPTISSVHTFRDGWSQPNSESQDGKSYHDVTTYIAYTPEVLKYLKIPMDHYKAELHSKEISIQCLRTKVNRLIAKNAAYQLDNSKTIERNSKLCNSWWERFKFLFTGRLPL